jgi:parvulin-like peptidyl-prolyl isomerase
MMERNGANHAGRSLLGQSPWSAALPDLALPGLPPCRRFGRAHPACRRSLARPQRGRVFVATTHNPDPAPAEPNVSTPTFNILPLWGKRDNPRGSYKHTAPLGHARAWTSRSQGKTFDVTCAGASAVRLAFVAFCLAVTTLFSLSCQRVHDSTPVIGSVNGHQIHRSAIESFMKVKMGELTLGDAPDSLRSQMLDEYIRRRLVLDEAARQGLSITDAEIEQAVQDNPQTRSAAAQEEARREFASDLLVAKYYRQVVLRDVRVSPEEAQSYIEQNRARLVESPVSYVREIRVENREEAERLRRDIAEGKQDFAEAARQHSQAPNAEQGGLMGYAKGQLPEVLEKAIDPLKPGDVSPVVQSSFGFHIFKLEQRTQPRAPDDKRSQSDERRSQLIEEAIERKNQHAVDDAIDRLVSSAAITINTSALGFTYVGRLGHN